MPDSQTRKERGFPCFWNRDLWTHSDTFIRSRKGFIPGGLIGLRQEKRMQVGVSITSVHQKHWKAREKNAGWRIDYFCVSDCLKEKLEDAKIHTDIAGSDHCPVELDIAL